MIYAELFFGFLKVGCFAFGGAYGAIPLIRDVVVSHGWLSEERLTDMIAVSESTPGPIMVNLATYVGSDQAGLAGAALATLAVVLPSFFVILLVASLLKTAVKNPWIQAALRGLKPCVAGIVLATGITMTVGACVNGGDWRAPVIAVILVGLKAGHEHVRKNKLSPILLILAAACLGAVVYGI